MNNQIREQFEAWAKDYGYKFDRFGSTAAYASDSTNKSWSAWRAALAASQTCIAKPELLVKTWQERMPKPKTAWHCAMNCSGVFNKPADFNCGDCEPFTIHGDPIAARDAEIADLRAALSASEAKNAKAKAPMPITDAAYNNLRSVGRMICNMLRRDETPVRAEAAEDLQHAIARLDPEMGETIIAPQPRQVAVSEPIIDLKMLVMELRGVIIDTEQGHGFDAACLETVKRVHDALAQNAGQGKPDRDGHFAAMSTTGDAAIGEKGNG